jgi:cyclic pyranopterin phosphate synthase
MVHALRVLQSTSERRPAAHVEQLGARSVRISVTDRCDMACVYCRPSRADGYIPAEDRLDVDEWESLVRGLIAAGVRRVRITGGEPLLFRGIVDVVKRIHALGVEDLAMTTNASRLAPLAKPLREAGLARINVSIDSLDRATFERLTRGGDLEEVLEGIDAALEAGFDEVKTNTVVVRGENDHEIEPLTRWAWSRGMTPRFLELMGVGEGAKLFRTRGVAYAEMRAAVAHLLAEGDAFVQKDRGPAKYVRSRDGAHRIGFITGTTDTFCGDCDRLRATSDGVLRPCLSRNDGVPVADVLDPAATPEARDAAVAERLVAAWSMKPDGNWKGCTEETAADVSMRATGG